MDSRPHTPALSSSYVHGTSTIPLLPLTVGQSLDSTVQRWPDREAVVFLQDGIRKTFAQFQQDVGLQLLLELSCIYYDMLRVSCFNKEHFENNLSNHYKC